MIDVTFIETRALVVLWPYLRQWVISERKVNGKQWTPEVLVALRTIERDVDEWRSRKLAEQDIASGATSGGGSEAMVAVEIAASRLGCSQQWVRQLCASGELEAVKRGGAWAIHAWSLAERIES